MITAVKARELAARSDTEIDRILTNIGAAIEKQAMLGKRRLDWHHISPHENVYDVVEPQAYRDVEFSPVQKLLKAKLELAGYGLKIESHTYDANNLFNSMADASDPPNMRTSYYIAVRW